jgi:uncharacterized protein
MQEIFAYSNLLIENVTLEFKRYLFREVNWKSRLIEILGNRGAGKTTLMLQKAKGSKILHKPDKIYLGNTNYFYALNLHGEGLGTLRETFFLTQLGVNHHLKIPRSGDFSVNDKYIFEIGGKNKTQHQIRDLNNAYLVLDDIENGVFNQIPLWLFGFLH